MNSSSNFARALRDTEFVKFFVFDVLVSVIIGFIVWIVTKDDVSSLVISLLIGTMLLVVELRFQLTRAKDDIGLILGIQKESFKDPLLFTTLQQITQEYSGVLSSGDRFFIERAQEVIGECNVTLTKLKEGHIEVSAGLVYSYMTTLMKQTRHSLFATSIVNVADFWYRGGGQEYLDENYRAVKRGVKITRVFIVTSVDEFTLQIRDLMAMQEKSGIDVRIAFTGDLSPDLIQDMAIWDERYVEYLELIPGSRNMRGTHFFGNEAELRKAKAICKRILEEARTASEVLRSGSNPPDISTSSNPVA